MIFKLHYWFLTAGTNAFTALLGVYIQEYTDASAVEIGSLYMLMPFLGILFRPVICSKADREQAHQYYLCACLVVVAVTYTPFVVIPLLGPEIYREHSRACWYTLVTLKILGDIAFGGVMSIGDALAINYAKRIGTQFSVYRVWGTISFMVFGLIIGQINEVSFLPKYTPAFIILIGCTLLDTFVIWLWPKEYFTMKSEVSIELNDAKRTGEKRHELFKSLLPREVVIAHMKAKLASLVTCSGYESSASEPAGNKISSSSQTACQMVDQAKDVSKTDHIDSNTSPINKRTQFRILCVLLRRDPRIILYLLFFAGAGSTLAPLGFAFMNVSDRCHEEGSCDFSLLAGFLQVAIASSETIVFLNVKTLQDKVGRVNVGAIAFALMMVKMSFYATVWQDVNPYWTILFDGFHGAAFAIYLTLMVELGYKFSNQIQYILPELIARGYVPKESDDEKLKLSLASTMQSLIASAMDGIGRGFGALFYGIILHHHSYTVLWRAIDVMIIGFTLVMILVSLCDYLFQFKLGLKVEAMSFEKKRTDLWNIEQMDCDKHSEQHQVA